jgi:hypothetical protein
VEGVKDYAIFMLDPESRVASWNEGRAVSRVIANKRYSDATPQSSIRTWI